MGTTITIRGIDPGAMRMDRPAPCCSVVPIRRVPGSITAPHVPELPETDKP